MTVRSVTTVSSMTARGKPAYRRPLLELSVRVGAQSCEARPTEDKRELAEYIEMKIRDVSQALRCLFQR